MENNRNLYFQDINNNINNNIENKLFYKNEYKPAVMPSQTKQSIKKEYIYIGVAAIIIITASNSFLTSSIVPNVSRSSIFCLTKILNSLMATLKKNLLTPLQPKIE